MDAESSRAIDAQSVGTVAGASLGESMATLGEIDVSRGVCGGRGMAGREVFARFISTRNEGRCEVAMDAWLESLGQPARLQHVLVGR